MNKLIVEKKECVMACGRKIHVLRDERPICEQCKAKMEGKVFVSFAQARRYVLSK